MPEQKFPEPCCGAMIFKGDKFLLVRSHKWKDKYVIPGGHVELGEKLEDALIREIKEETDLNIYDLKFISYQEFIFDKVFWKKKHFIFFDFACRTDSTDVKLDSEAQEHVWVTVNESKKLDVEPYTRKTIETYIKSL